MADAVTVIFLPSTDENLNHLHVQGEFESVTMYSLRGRESSVFIKICWCECLLGYFTALSLLNELHDRKVVNWKGQELNKL